eukprot:821024_1
MSSSLSLLTLSCIFHTTFSNISPTTSNSSGSFWIASDYSNSSEYFQSASITCSASYCHIVCDEVDACSHLTVYASASWSTLAVQCLDSLSCNSAVIYANTTNSVKLTCDNGALPWPYYNGACHWLQLYARNVKNSVDIACIGPYACRDASFDASLIGTSLNVTCDGKKGCYDTDIYCPQDVPCNIDCGVTDPSYSCYRPKLHIASRRDNTLNLETLCSAGPNECVGVSVVCDDTDLKSYLAFSDSKWGCKNGGCCPYERFSIVCSAGVPCQIDCDSQTCYYPRFNATEATSLTLDCGTITKGCQDAIILCPTGANTSCNIRCPSSYSCQYAHVQTGTNKMKHLGLSCGTDNQAYQGPGMEDDGSYACQYMQLQVNSAEVTKVDLNCSTSHSCYGLNTVSSGESSITYLDIDCTEENACYLANISATIASNALIGCVNPSISSSHTSGACYSAGFHIYGDNRTNEYIYGDNRTNNISFLCGAYDCYEAILNASDFYWVDIRCTGENACYLATISATIVTYLNIDCTEENACYLANISATIASNALIGCVNPSISSSHTSGACYSAGFYIYGDNRTNNISFLCGAYDCYEAILNASDFDWVDIRCNNSYACWKSEIYAPKSGQLSVQCAGENGCQFVSIDASKSDQLAVECSEENGCLSATIYCPSTGPCNIDCLDFSACTGVRAEIVGETADQLTFNCNDPSYGCGYEETPHILCIDSGDMGDLIWSSYLQRAVCYGDCCPSQITSTTAGTSLLSTMALFPSLEATVADQSLAGGSGSDNVGIIVVLIIISVLLIIVIAVGIYCFRLLNKKIELLTQSKEEIERKLMNVGSSGDVVKVTPENNNDERRMLL